MMWLLDSGPLDRLAQVASASQWAWPGGLLHIAQMVEWEQRTNVRVRELLARTSSTGEPWITRHEIAVGSPAELCRRSQRMLSHAPDRREQIPARFWGLFD